MKNNKFTLINDLFFLGINYRSQTSMYHSIGSCVFKFLEAMLTFEQQHIADASEALKACLSLCNRHRKKNTITESIGKTFKRVSFNYPSGVCVCAMMYNGILCLIPVTCCLIAQLWAIHRDRGACRALLSRGAAAEGDVNIHWRRNVDQPHQRRHQNSYLFQQLQVCARSITFRGINQSAWASASRN